MSNYGGDPTVGDIEAAVSALKAEADRATRGPAPADMERMFSLQRVAAALEALLPRSQTVSLARVRPSQHSQWNGT